MQVENQSMISPAPLYIFFCIHSRKILKSIISISSHSSFFISPGGRELKLEKYLFSSSFDTPLQYECLS